MKTKVCDEYDSTLDALLLVGLEIWEQIFWTLESLFLTCEFLYFLDLLFPIVLK